MSEPYKMRTYFGIALDPIHVGTGGYRLGRVDNSIVRDKATNLPIIPGSSIEGVTRTYATYKLMESNSSIKQKKSGYLNCAGKDTEEKSQCGKCEICITFGFSNKDGSLHGMAQFSDAKILFFPVHTMIGPVWVTSPSVLNDLNEQKLNFKKPEENKFSSSESISNKKLNLGWLYLERDDKGQLNLDGVDGKIPAEIKNNAVLVSDKLFSQVVNSNLEVRTSVSIDPQTGAAEEGALFTYEAVPRTTILYWDIIYNNPKMFPGIVDINGWDIELPVKEGMKLYEFLGVGGMGTRGFGRMRVLNLEGDKSGK